MVPVTRTVTILVMAPLNWNDFDILCILPSKTGVTYFLHSSWQIWWLGCFWMFHIKLGYYGYTILSFSKMTLLWIWGSPLTSIWWIPGWKNPGLEDDSRGRKAESVARHGKPDTRPGKTYKKRWKITIFHGKTQLFRLGHFQVCKLLVC